MGPTPPNSIPPSEAQATQESPKLLATGNIPVADVQRRPPGLLAQLAASYMWVLAIFCLVVAVVLVWFSMPEQGIPITIRFPEGHGLEPGDQVRFRGIEVGTVRKVSLNSSLKGVDVSVSLLPFAEPIAREGSRFWIVRPELSLGQVSGLETAVGHKYIGVLPGDPNAEWRVSFDGMANSPPDTRGDEGTEIILRAEQRHGVSPGSPLHFRGLIVGRVISVDLARDAKFVEMRVKVYEEFTKLVTSETKFWASSGVNLDLRWGSGLKVDVESLETIVKGGVSMLTVQAGGKSVQPGQLFELAATPEDKWFEMARETSVTETQNLRAALKLRATWKQSGMIFGTVDKEAMFVGTHVRLGAKDFIVAPSDSLTAPEKSKAGSFHVNVAGESANLLDDASVFDQAMTRLPIKENTLARSVPFSKNEIRRPEAIEACLAVRMEGDISDPNFFHMPINEESLDNDWGIKDFDGDRDVWHGAPVVADADNRLIGFLSVEKSAAKVIPVSEELLSVE